MMTSDTSIVCLATKPQHRCFLLPVAAAGGWQLLSAAGQEVVGRCVVVACCSDEARALRAGAHGTVLMEHGLGQSYVGLPATSPYAPGRGRVAGRCAMLVPGPIAARLHGAESHVPVMAVGSTFLDGWAGYQPRAWREGDTRPIVAVSTHWDSQVLPEVSSSWPWLKWGLEDLARDERWRVMGHYHPHEAAMGGLKARLAFYQRLGIEVVADWAEVMQRADLYVTDNSSSLYEFAALGKPVVVVSPPWYRREVQHGLRFWEALPGPEVVDLDKLIPTVADALADDTRGAALRGVALPLAWGELDGMASRRAAGLIRDFA